MENSTLVFTGTNEQNLTPGEQRLQALLDQRLDRVNQQLKDLARMVELEAAKSEERDRQLANEIQHLRLEVQERDTQLRGTMDRRVTMLRKELCERFD
ncbi:hypothetical protein [Archangium lipolyticum]|uniref:hypothetical protein n=1 Tax=Archangium lipolyticum TaxID=2970465 RepID=UPI00214A2F05|nr:hypothetical protein [Archangium lipolyticum]